MTTSKLPPLWASNTVYSAGPDTGAPTCIDPASNANGFIRGVAAAAQQVNFELNLVTSAARRAFEIAALRLHEIRLEGSAITDTAESMTALQRNAGAPVVAIKTAQALLVSGWDRWNAQGVPSTITSLVCGGIVDPVASRFVIVGTGGHRTSTSTDDGATWAAGGDLGFASASMRIAYSSRAATPYLAGHPASRDAKTSTAAAVSGDIAWTTFANAMPTGVQDIAPNVTMATANSLFLDSATSPAFRVGPISGFANAGGTVANAGSHDESGSLCGDSGATAYHVGRLSSGASLQISSTSDLGTTWTTIATISPPSTFTFNSRPRLFQCPNTGLLVIVAPLTSTADALYASLDGVDWVGPTHIYPGPGTAAYAVAGGRVLATMNDMLFASDGIGF